MKFLFTLLVAATSLVTTVRAQAGSDTGKPVFHDKAFLLDYYQQTLDNLKQSISGLTEAQMTFKPAGDRWSVSQCVEHITMTEKMLLGFAQQALSKPANPERRKEVKTSDNDLIKNINNRDYKAKASAELTGKGTHTNPEKAIADFSEQRKEILAAFKDVPLEDLRNHINDSPFGPVDAYHSFLFIAGHTSRHTQQIEEVKADANFPKK